MNRRIASLTFLTLILFLFSSADNNKWPGSDMCYVLTGQWAVADILAISDDCNIDAQTRYRDSITVYQIIGADQTLDIGAFDCRQRQTETKQKCAISVICRQSLNIECPPKEIIWKFPCHPFHHSDSTNYFSQSCNNLAIARTVVSRLNIAPRHTTP